MAGRSWIRRIAQLRCMVLLLLAALTTDLARGRSLWEGSIMLNAATPIYTAASEGSPVYLAVQALQRDMEKVLGSGCRILPFSAIDKPGIVVCGPGSRLSVNPLKGQEAHRLLTTRIKGTPQVILQGADMRGVIYAIYTFSEKVLGVPPLWYFIGWRPIVKKEIKIVPGFWLNYPSPEVKYRAWFPNDMDLLEPWRKLSKANDEMWLETALRLKLNTIEWFDNQRDYSQPYGISATTRLISRYGLIYTSHHHSPLNASFSDWKDYWQKTRDTVMPELSLKNKKYIEAFWRYNVASIVKNKIDMLWVLGFRGAGDHPFWYSFKDAPHSMKQRGAVISRMIQRQREIVLEITGDRKTPFRTIFYDELSDLLAKGYLQFPADTSLIQTYVAARRDHYPNKDIRQVDKRASLRLGYYFNYQFTSTGSHLAPAEGPWKMERNFRYVAGKSHRPIAYAVVNAGNIRAFVMELSANAKMMWNFKSYSTDNFLLAFCAQYFGQKNAAQAAALYKAYYNAFWNQRKPDLDSFPRQYIFQDLRYRMAIQEIAGHFGEPNDLNPLKDIAAEQVKGRTYRIIATDNRADNQIDAIITGTILSAACFEKVAEQADSLYKRLQPAERVFFSDNLRQPACYMYYLNETLLTLCKAYKEHDPAAQQKLLEKTVSALDQAQEALLATAHGRFSSWYTGDRIFGFRRLRRAITDIKTGNQ